MENDRTQTDRTPATEEDARALIARAQAALVGPCSRCSYVPFGQSPGEGWESSVTRAAWVLRCDTCRTTLAYPWASQLDVDRVREFLDARADRMFSLQALEPLTRRI